MRRTHPSRWSSTPHSLALALALAFVLAFPLGSTSALAAPPQQTTVLSGTVYDATHSVVQRATVTLTNAAGEARTATTDDAGRYQFTRTEAGVYDMKAAYRGFKTATVTGLDLRAGAPAVQDFTLEAAQVGEVVTVQEALPQTAPDPMTQAQSAETLPATTLNRAEGLFLDKALNLVPGVFVEKRNALGGMRITIRGYGTSQYGASANTVTAGFKAYLNGIPLTSADGQTLLDDLDFSAIGRVDVIKGPASSLYGAGIGGVVQMYTLQPDTPGTRVVQQTMAGSDGLWRTNTRLEYATNTSMFAVNYGHMEYGGYRPHNDSNRDFATVSGTFKASDRQSISVFASYTHLFDRSAGQLSRADYLARLNIASSNHLAVDVNDSYDTHRFGLAHLYRFSPRVSLETSTFYSGFNEGSQYTQGYSSYANQNFGERTALSVKVGPPVWGFSGVLGNESQKTVSFYKNYGFTPAMQVGAMNTDDEITTIENHLFTQWDVTLPSRFVATAGVSGHFLRFRIADGLAYPGNTSHLSQAGTRNFPGVATWRVALLRPIGQRLSLFGNVSQGYTAPPTTMFVIPYLGTVNNDLGPERATSYEAGAKGKLFGDRLSYQASAFSMHVSDKITPQTVTDAQNTVLYTFYRNVGRQRNDGLELNLDYSLERPDRVVSSLHAFAAYTYSYFTYTDFKSDNNHNSRTVDYTGLHVSGVPPHMVSAGLDLATKWGAYANTTLRYVDQMPINYANTAYANTYTVLDAKAGIRRAVGRFSLDAYLGGNNLTNSTYYTMVYLNSTNSGLFIPGPYTATLYGGLDFRCRF